MTSNELNDAIAAICERDNLMISGGKTIPYIGWYWRPVDFDADGYVFGIVPGKWAGFMENNKWDYGYTRRTTPQEWAEVKRLLGAAVTNPSRQTSQAVWDYIQAIAR